MALPDIVSKPPRGLEAYQYFWLPQSGAQINCRISAILAAFVL